LTSHCNDLDEAGVQAQLSGVCGASRLPNGEGYGPAFGLGANSIDIRVSNGCAFLIEIMGTYLLVFTVLQAAVHTKSTGGNAIPIAIGWSVLVAHLILIPYTGCGINPARSLGPMVSTSTVH
jgi:glycerol uptake facilitator-like aquaporin